MNESRSRYLHQFQFNSIQLMCDPSVEEQNQKERKQERRQGIRWKRDRRELMSRLLRTLSRSNETSLQFVGSSQLLSLFAAFSDAREAGEDEEDDDLFAVFAGGVLDFLAFC